MGKMEEGIVHAAFVDVQDVPCGPLSPETSEFINLERQLIMDEPNFIIGQQSPVPNIPSVQHNSSRKSSEIQREMEAEEQSRQLLQSELEEKLEERKRSMELSSTENGLQLMERRQFRQFSRADEYLYAMKEDLAEWENILYSMPMRFARSAWICSTSLLKARPSNVLQPSKSLKENCRAALMFNREPGLPGTTSSISS